MFSASILLFAILFSAYSGAQAQQSAAPATEGSPVPGLPGITVALGLNPAAQIEWLLVYQNRQQVQKLNVCTGSPVPRQDPVGSLNMADFNFDGVPDLALQVSAEKGNQQYCIWLFDSSTQRFVLNEQLSKLTNPMPDPQTKTVVSTQTLGCNGACYSKKIYEWSQEELELTREVTRTREPLAIGFGGCDYIESVSTIKDGELREIGRDRVNASGVRCDR